MKPRSQLEAEVITKCKKLSKYLNISEDEAEKRAKQLLPANSDKDLRDFLSQPLKKLTLNFLDPGHRAADKKIAQMDREVSKVYSRASEEMSQKLEKYLDKFREADERMKKNVSDGLMSEDDYKTWRKGQMMQVERWTHMRDELAADASNSVDIAKSVIQGHMPEVYAENFNYGTYEIEHGTRMNTSFTLYDRQTVERLLRDNPKLLPDPSKGSKTALKIAKNKDLRWNRNHIQGELLQGILQGESIPDIAKRMRNVEKMNKRASMNYARTMTTGAENAGRIDSYKRAQDMGIDVGPAWMATLDGRTRDSHRHLDGERRNEKTGKFSNGCRYPGDPQGRPEEVYNCRCTLVAQIKGFESDFSDMSWRNNDKLDGMSYNEWKQGKKKKQNQFGYNYGDTFSIFPYKGDMKAHDVTLKKEKNVKLYNGANGIHQIRDCDVYTTDDGTKFYFPSDLDTTKQTMKPEMALSVWYDIPEKYRKQIQNEVYFYDYRNPQDSYWEETYGMKNFYSYATGGERIEFYQYDYEHNPDYLLSTYEHEGGHYIDLYKNNGISSSDEYKKAMKEDEKLTGEEYSSDYARESQAVAEDFADGIAEYLSDPSFKKRFKNRCAIYKRLIDNGAKE